MTPIRFASPAPVDVDDAPLHAIPLPELRDLVVLSPRQQKHTEFCGTLPDWVIDAAMAKLGCVRSEPYTTINRMVDHVMQLTGIEDRSVAEKLWLHDLRDQVRAAEREYQASLKRR